MLRSTRAIVVSAAKRFLDRFGSISTELGCPRHVRFTPDSDQTADIPDGQLRAISRSRTTSLTGRDRQDLRRASAVNRLLLREDNVRGSFRRNMLDCPISQSAKIQAAKERFPLAKRNWSKSEVNFIHVAGLNVLPHRLGTAANLYVLCACRFACLLQRIFDAIRDKMKSRSAQHLDWWPWIMCQYESWRMIRRIVTPPAFPLFVRPFPTNRSEHVATKDEGTETFHGAPGEPIIKASFTVLFSQHLAKSPCREEPLKDLLATQTKRVIQTLIGSRSEAIKLDTEPGHFYFSH